jgi:cAMP-dependent protein kinase regulator
MAFGKINSTTPYTTTTKLQIANRLQSCSRHHLSTMDTSLCNNSSHHSVEDHGGGEAPSEDPTHGFKDILSRWKDKDATSHHHDHVSNSDGNSKKNMPPLDITTVGRRMSREQAKQAYELKKKESFTKSDVDKSAIRNGLRQPKNVYQQPLQHKQDFCPPTFAHTDAERELIKSALRRNFVFSDLSSRDLKPLIAAFEVCVFAANQTIISQGEPGDFFYVIQEGKVKFQVNDKTVGKAGKGNSFGELALLYTCPRAATVIASKETRLFRVDQMTFRFILQHQTKQSEKEKTDLLRGVNFLKDLDASDIKKLCRVMTPRFFSVDDVLVRKGEPGDAFYVLQEGKVLVKDISVGSTVYEDQVLGSGEYFGERSLCTSEPRAANVVGLTRGVAFSIDRTTFEKVLGSMSRLILKAQDVRKLAGVSILQNAGLDGRQMASLAELITDVSVKAGTKVLTKGEKARAALYFVREGAVEITQDDSGETLKVPAGGYFGQCLMIDASRKLYPLVTCQFSCSVSVDSVLGMLSLSDCRMVFDTEVLGLLDPSESDDKPSETSQLTSTLRLEDLHRHKILGAGTFGQVWLVSGQEKGRKGRSPFALKIQAKSDLAAEGQIKAVIEEKNIMCKMRHPFIAQLIQTYQDPSFVYMLVELIVGGELFSIIHDVNAETDGMPEKQARFYAFGVADALAYLHRAKYVFRYVL